MNAKKEFIGNVDKSRLLCAWISHGDDIDDSPVFWLRIGYSEKEYEAFLNNLDFEYDDGFGRQELFGTVWFKDGKWLDRGEYDGSEWWAHQICPEIPPELNPKQKGKEDKMSSYWDAFLKEFPQARECTIESVLMAFYHWTNGNESGAADRIPGMLVLKATNTKGERDESI